jgi:hypothetical protein
MKVKKQTISLICFLLLTLWALNIFNISNERNGFGFRLLVASAIVIIPVVFTLLITLLKKSLLHISFWVSTTLVITAFIFLFYRTGTAPSYEPEGYYATRTYYQHKTGIFTAYAPIILFSENEIDSNTKQIIKYVYRAGSKKVENYYMAKVLVDTNYKVAKEIYNLRVLNDTILFKQEFRKTIIDLKASEELIDNR